MKVLDNRQRVFAGLRHAAAAGVLLWAAGCLGGCTILSFLASPGPYEQKIPAAYDLQQQQHRKILLVVECPRSSGVDFDVPKTLFSAFETFLTSQMKIDPDHIVRPESGTAQAATLDPVRMARRVGAGYVLLVQVERYRLGTLNTRNYFAGEMRSRAVLIDADLDATVWPEQPEGKIVHVGVDLETAGREMALTRLTSATAHCVLRYLYPCDKLKYKNSDEVLSLRDAFDMETF